MTLFIIIIAALFLLLIGFAIVDLFGFLEKKSLLEKISYSWGLGVGLIGLQLFLYSLGNIPWNLINLLTPWFILITILLYKKRNNLKITIKWQLTPLQTFFTFLIIVLLLFTGFESVLRPVQAWDGWDNWILRPKVFYLHNNINLDYVHYTSDDYPLIMPLMSTFGYLMIGGIDDKNILFLHYMFYLALGGLFFATTKRMLATKNALILTFLLLSLQNLIRHGGRFEVGQSDLALGYYIFASTILLLNFLKTKNVKTLLFLSFFIGITGQIKNDGMAFFVIINLILLSLLIFWRKYKYLLFLLPSVLLIGLWELYKYINHYPSNFLLRSTTAIHFDKIGAIFIAMLHEFINFQNWSLLWIVFFVAIIANWPRIKEVKVILLVLFLQWFSYFVVFLITPREPVGHVENVIDKLYIHLAPLAVLVIGILLQSQFDVLNKLSFWRTKRKALKTKKKK